MWRQWKCTSCGNTFNWAIEFPAQDLKACVFYGAKGRHPFSKPYNDGELNARFLYCKRCVE